MAHVTVMEWQRVLAYVDGRFDRVLEPGRHRYRERRTRLVTVDVRPSLLTVSGQEVITADGVTVRASLTALWRVDDPVAYTTGAEHPQALLYAAVQDALRDRMAAVTLDDALQARAALSDGLAEAVRTAVSGLGIVVNEVRVRDLMLPGELRRAAMDAVVARERGKAATGGGAGGGGGASLARQHGPAPGGAPGAAAPAHPPGRRRPADDARPRPAPPAGVVLRTACAAPAMTQAVFVG
ncbi:hypothetical protein GCM10009530_14270 [Microbispora corallina]|uniref:Band 7 domain-containing protein n=1 Tax=Microbispora corallina TaxID=83302 RepID=A0ABQ4FSS0_9ACTN|nr:SPFH domain-containing protein [Microbispora corallina]GIH37876.1 hypothetical protein Mco01_08760 [Microbispora corallina]